MSTISDTAEDVEDRHPTAPNIITTFPESASDSESVPERDEAESVAALKIADKAGSRVHHYSRSIAKEHGVNAAAVLSGMAFKLKYHKRNLWKDRYWYYETLETLSERRWPYFSPSGLWGILEYLTSNPVGLLHKDCNNKVSYDRTSWYAIDDDIRDNALRDLIWFDVKVAKAISISAAAIYHNLRYHLREEMKQNPTSSIPYHRLNKKQLSRSLGIDYSTVKRAVIALVDQGFIREQGGAKNRYTLTDQEELGENSSSANENGPIPNRNGSNANGSIANENGASVNRNGSFSEQNGSFSDDNTRYETVEKPLEKPIRNSGSPDNASRCEERKVSRQEFAHPFTPTHEIVTRFQDVVTRNKQLSEEFTNLDSEHDGGLTDQLQEISTWLVTEILTPEQIATYFSLSDANSVLNSLEEAFRQQLGSEIEGLARWLNRDMNEVWALFYYPGLEILVRSFQNESVWSRQYATTLPKHWDVVDSVHTTVMNRVEECAEFSAQKKAQIFMHAVEVRNRYGWILDETVEKHAVIVKNDYAKGIADVFEKNLHLPAGPLIQLLHACVTHHYDAKKPEEFDPYWHARRGINLAFFLKNLEKIVLQLRDEVECPVTAV